MEQHPRQLPIPTPAASDSRARELVRVWAAGGKQHVTLATEIWEDPAYWGLLLVDLAKHLANAYSQTRAMDPAATLERIKAGFDAEWARATDTPTGSVG